MRIDDVYLVELDGLLFDLQVGVDSDGERTLVVADLVELFANEQGVIDSLRQHGPQESLLPSELVSSLDEAELRLLAERRADIAILAINLVGLSFDQALLTLIGG